MNRVFATWTFGEAGRQNIGSISKLQRTLPLAVCGCDSCNSDVPELSVQVRRYVTVRIILQHPSGDLLGPFRTFMVPEFESFFT